MQVGPVPEGLQALNIEETLLSVEKVWWGIAKRLQSVTDGRGQLLAIADSLGDITAPYAGAGFDQGAWKDGGLTSRAQTYDPRRWETDSDWGGVQQFRHRAYDPKSARWLQEDPIGLSGGVNLYRYNAGNPVSFSDPYGLCTPKPDCLFQWMADWSARHGGTTGDVLLNLSAGLNAASEAMGFNDLGAAIGRGDVLGTAVAAAGVLPVGKAGRAVRGARSAATSKTVDDIMRYLGDDAFVKFNDFGDLIVSSKNGLREIRFDFNNFAPHHGPHLHVIEYVAKKNKKERVFNERIFGN